MQGRNVFPRTCLLTKTLAPLDGGRRADPAPDQDTHHSRGEAGFDFLGWHFRGGKKWPRQKSLQKLQGKLRPLTGRTNGRSLSEIIAKANPILRGWHGYFRGSYRTGPSGPDGWLRRRLRALLRKREQRPGYGLSEADSRRWPNRWFAARGLFSLEHGTCAYGQSR